MNPNIPTNATQITLRDSIISAGLSLSVAERTAMELEYLLGGYNRLGEDQAGEKAAPHIPGICESAHDLSCRIQRLSELLETVRGMLSHDTHSGQNMASGGITWANGEIHRQ